MITPRYADREGARARAGPDTGDTMHGFALFRGLALLAPRLREKTRVASREHAALSQDLGV